MSKSRIRRSSPPVKVRENTLAAAEYKIFYIAEDQLCENNKNNVLQLERFYHPGKGRATLFMTRNNKDLLEVLEYAEPRRSWLIGSRVCSNGRIYMTTPIDATFLALHHIRRHCADKALALDTICVDEDKDGAQRKEATAASTRRLLTTFVDPSALRCIADVKSAADMTFYKYNAEKTLAWLSLKTRHVATSLQSAGVHCGHSALSQNYARSERAPAEELTHQIDYLRMACDIVGGYLDLELHEALIAYLEIPSELKAKAEEVKTTGVGKRKSLQSLSAAKNKKFKLNDKQANEKDEEEENGASNKLKNTSLLDESPENKTTSSSPASAAKAPATPQRALSAKEKALAKGAKGTKSIASFFKK